MTRRLRGVRSVDRLARCTFYDTHCTTVIDGQHNAAEDAAVLLSKRRRQELVREWLKSLDGPDRQAVGQDLMRAQWRWLVGRRCAGHGTRAVGNPHRMPSHRIARALLCLHAGSLAALHGFIKKTQKTPDDELALARKRQKELKS